LALALPLKTAIAVDDREIMPIKSARINSARASVDCGVARSSYAKLAIICYGGTNEVTASHPDQKTKNYISYVSFAPHLTSPSGYLLVEIVLARRRECGPHLAVHRCSR